MQKISADPIIYTIIGTQYVQLIDKETSNFINVGLLLKEDREPRILTVIKNVFADEVMESLWTWRTKVTKEFLCQKIGETTKRTSNDLTRANALSVIEKIFETIEDELGSFEVTKLVYSGLDFIRSADPANRDVEMIISNIKERIAHFYKPSAWPKIDEAVLQFVQNKYYDFSIEENTTGGFFSRVTAMFGKTSGYTAVETGNETERLEKPGCSTTVEEEEEEEEEMVEENGCYIKDCEGLMLLKPHNHKNEEWHY